MANWTLTNTTTSVTFNVTGLNVGDGVRFFLRYDPAPADGSMILDGGTTYTATGSTMTKTFSDVLSRGHEYAANVRINNATVRDTWIFDTLKGERPEDWEWVYPKVYNEEIFVTGMEWNSFQTRINQFRTYKDMGPASFTSVGSGMTITASIVNEAIDNISAIPGHGTLPSRAVANETYISASFFNQLAAALNAVQ